MELQLAKRDTQEAAETEAGQASLALRQLGCSVSRKWWAAHVWPTLGQVLQRRWVAYQAQQSSQPYHTCDVALPRPRAQLAGLEILPPSSAQHPAQQAAVVDAGGAAAAQRNATACRPASAAGAGAKRLVSGTVSSGRGGRGSGEISGGMLCTQPYLALYRRCPSRAGRLACRLPSLLIHSWRRPPPSSQQLPA